MSIQSEIENEVTINDNKKSEIHTFQIRPTQTQK